MSALLVALLLVASSEDDAKVSRRRVDAPDGYALGLYRYEPRVLVQQRPAVVLFGDFGFGRTLFTGGEQPLAQYLVSQGFRVYIPQVREQGKIADIAGVDVPAVLKAVRRENEGPLHVIAHGWLGTLVLAALAQPETPRVNSVVALNTPATAEVPSESVARFLEREGRFSQLSATHDGLHQFEDMMALWSQMKSRELKAIAQNGMRDLGPDVSSQLLEWMKRGDLALSEGTVAQRLQKYEVPTLLLVGLADGFANPELVTPLRDVSPAKVRVHVFTRVENSEDYSHLSLLQGPHVRTEVFAPIVAFLRGEGT